MKWFFCFYLQPGGSQSLVRVAVESALRNTTLEPYCICDDALPDLVEWMTERRVVVVPYTTPLLPTLREVYGKDSPARGAFLRCHIPAIAEEMGITDRYVLYTDYDVMFRRNPVRDLRRMKSMKSPYVSRSLGMFMSMTPVFIVDALRLFRWYRNAA